MLVGHGHGCTAMFFHCHLLQLIHSLAACFVVGCVDEL